MPIKIYDRSTMILKSQTKFCMMTKKRAVNIFDQKTLIRAIKSGVFRPLYTKSENTNQGETRITTIAIHKVMKTAMTDKTILVRLNTKIRLVIQSRQNLTQKWCSSDICSQTCLSSSMLSLFTPLYP